MTDSSALVLLIENENETAAVREQCLELDPEKNPVLAGIGEVDWNHDLSPWKADPVFKKGAPFTGGARDFLKNMSDSILPEILRELPVKPRYIVMAGYSLAGLFAVYGALETDLFDGIVSASGSMWFPEFVNYVQEYMEKSLHISEQKPISSFSGKSEVQTRKLRTAYFSVGDREAKTKNPVMQTVEKNTIAIQQMFDANGIMTTFELNPGNHFTDDVGRLAKGICWTLRSLDT